jgi:LmbE family N-acetylglucosaminyl deacetylase
MMRVGIEPPRSALAIAAHPDDVEFQAGATLAKWAAAGTVVHHLICTDGSKGSWDVREDTAALVATRQVEQRAAARALGATGEQVFLDNVDGELEAGMAQRAEVCRWIRTLQPDVVLGHDPWKRWRLHPDHRAAGFLCIDGVVAARDPHFFPAQGIAHHRPSAILLFESEEPDHAEDVTGFLDRKVAALLEHRSQFVTTHGIADADDEAQVERFRRHLDERLAAAGAAVGRRHAEVFRLLTRI